MPYKPYRRTKLGVYTLLLIIILLIVAKATGKGPDTFGISTSKTYKFEFKDLNSFNIKEVEDNSEIGKIIDNNLQGVEGEFGIVIESLDAKESYGHHELEIFPAASLYKLIVIAAVYKEIERGDLKLDQSIYGNKAHLTEVLGSVDYGYENAPESISYTVEKALDRVARISDNFAAIMLTEKLRQIRASRDGDSKLLVEMTKDLGMKNTSFDTDPISTTPYDIREFFRRLADGQVVSADVSGQIIDLLSKAQINNRIPAQLPKDEVRVIHKTGELSRIRHDAGIVYLASKQDKDATDSALEPNQSKNGYIIVLMSKDLQYEDDAIEREAKISKDIYDYFKSKANQ